MSKKEKEKQHNPFDSITKEKGEEFKKRLKERRDELQNIIGGLKENKELLDIMIATGNYNMLATVAKRLDVWDLETVSEMMCEGCLDIVKVYIKTQDKGLYFDDKHQLVSVENEITEAQKCMKEMYERLKFLQGEIEKDNIIPHQYNAVVENILRIAPDKTGNVADLITKTNDKAFCKAREAYDSYCQMKI